MSSMYAKVIADSIANDIRLTTLECYYPLMIHAQLMTHRMFSRNAQSNRAMPVAKMLEQVRNNPAMPSHWGKNQAGMSASDELVGDDLVAVKSIWECAASDAEYWMEETLAYNLHKQVANRLTMPFQYIKVIVTATEWDNFFNLRLNDADPTMMELARKMKKAMDNSIPKELKPGEWHLPYVNSLEVYDDIYNDLSKAFTSKMGGREVIISDEDAIKCSVARVARVSLNNHDKSDPVVSKDIERHDQLLSDYHMSPFEHQATPMEEPIGWECIPASNWRGRKGVTHMDMNGNAWSSNFRGWIQFRQLVG